MLWKKRLQAAISCLTLIIGFTGETLAPPLSLIPATSFTTEIITYSWFHFKIPKVPWAAGRFDLQSVFKECRLHTPPPVTSVDRSLRFYWHQHWDISAATLDRRAWRLTGGLRCESVSALKGLRRLGNAGICQSVSSSASSSSLWPWTPVSLFVTSCAELSWGGFTSSREMSTTVDGCIPWVNNLFKVSANS